MSCWDKHFKTTQTSWPKSNCFVKDSKHLQWNIMSFGEEACSNFSVLTFRQWFNSVQFWVFFLTPHQLPTQLLLRSAPTRRTFQSIIHIVTFVWVMTSECFLFANDWTVALFPREWDHMVTINCFISPAPLHKLQFYQRRSVLTI